MIQAFRGQRATPVALLYNRIQARRQQAVPVTQSKSAVARGLVVSSIALVSFDLSSSGLLFAQSETPVPVVGSTATVTVEQIDGAIADVETRDGLDEETRGQIVEQLRAAKAQLQTRADHVAAAEAYTESLSSAPVEAERLRAQLEVDAVPTTPDSLGITDQTSLADLEQMLAQALALRADYEADLADLEANIASEQARPAEIRERMEEIRSTRAQSESQKASSASGGNNSLLVEAERLAADLRVETRNAELNSLEQELLSHSVRLDLMRTQRDVLARKVSAARQDVALIQQLVNAARQDDAARLLQETQLAQLANENKHPVIRDLAKQTVELGAELPGLITNIQRVTSQLDDVSKQARQIENVLETSRKRLEVGGISQAIGQLFAEERRNLPQVSQYRQQVQDRSRTLAEIGLAQVRIEEERRALTPIDNRADEIVDEIADESMSEDEIAAIRADVQQLLVARRGVLNQLASTNTTYLRALSDLDIAQRRLLNVAADYKEFLDEHLLWIPSTPPVSMQTSTGLGAGLAWALSPESWAETASDFLVSVSAHPLRTILAVLLIGMVLLARRELSRYYKTMNQKVGHLSTDHIGLTLQALGIALVVALPLPLALWAVGWLLYRGPVTTEFTLAVAAGLLAVGPFLYNLTLFRKLCAPQGVMQTHFGWGESMLATIRRQLDLLIAGGVPLAFTAIVAYQSSESAVRDSLGRLAFVGLMTILAVVLTTIASPRSGVVRIFYDSNPDSWITRLRWLWYSLAVFAPVSLAILVLVGYLYTASALAGEVVDTIWLILLLIVINLVALRWLSLTRRKLAVQRALEARAARKAELEESNRENTNAAEDESDAPGAIQAKPISLEDVDQQARRLLNAGLTVLGVLGLFAIWSDVFPALRFLDNISLWTETVSVDGQDISQPITLADLLLALIVLAVTWIASRNLPVLMEIAVLQHLDLQPGSRYAINTLVRYVVVTIGIIAVLNIIGWNWSRIQWLVAALSVGLGFGLQEIVANFVSGLIILFERPVRVGDTVTVGNLSGTVSKVRIRATTITDWDRKEIIVPNKAFITDQVVNWTLSDPITRITIEVGIAYGSDVELAHRVIEEALTRQPLILDEPPPKAYFVGFGESSLNFRLYVFARQLSDRFPMIHAVHQDVLRALRDNGIEIPFPQRDLHVRSVAPDTRWNVGQDGAPSDDQEPSR